mgnify:CR=1 FL=1
MLPWNEDCCQFTPKPYRVSIIPMWDIWMKWQSLGSLLELAHSCLYESGRGSPRVLTQIRLVSAK